MEVVHSANSARAENGEDRCSNYIFHQAQIGAFELSFAMHSGYENTSKRKVIELVHKIENVARVRTCPSARYAAAISGIGGDDDRARKLTSDVAEPCGIFDCSRADAH